MRSAIRKNARHKKKITAIEKRYPVFGLVNSDFEGVNGTKLSKINQQQIQEESKRGSYTGPDHAEMMTFLEELDDKLEATIQVIEEDTVDQLKEFISKRATARYYNKQHLITDGELSREIAAFLKQKVISTNESGN